MQVTRRQFFKICGAGLGASSVAYLGFAPEPALAEVRAFKLARTRESRSICPYCSVSCGVLMHTMGSGAKNAHSSIIHIEGDPDNPVNRGTLCPKGAGLLDMIKSPHRLKQPEYRAPGSDQWQAISWDEALTKIARLMKDDRDANFIVEERQGRAREPLDQHRFPREQRGEQRVRLPDAQGGPRARHGGDRHPGTHLTRTDGGQSGPEFRSRFDDEQLGRHQECRPRADHGRERRRGAPLRVQVGH